MNLLDIIVLLVVILQAFRWARHGFTRGFLAIGGFWLGIFLGALLAPAALGFMPDDATFRLTVATLIVVISGLAVGAIGQFISTRIEPFTRSKQLQPLDAVMGAALGASASLIIIWLFAAIVSGSHVHALNQQIRESAILQTMNEHLPAAPDVISRLTLLINPQDFPEVFTGLEPRPVEPVDPPSSGELRQALDAAGESTVRIEGAGCGGVVNGSGFVVADELVMTNAHVVAGISSPRVISITGSHESIPILFDSDLDIAILRVPDLAEEPLALASGTYQRSDTGAVLGYPGGGSLTVEEAAVLRQMSARGRDIYGERIVTRQVYELQTKIASGNSGGPLVRPDGEVFGMIFARSDTNPLIGYAITAPAVADHLEAASNLHTAVNTGRCVRQG